MRQPHPDHADIEQFNLGSHIRNAARDYLEIHKASTARQLIETSVMDELDSMSAENESVFRQRFGFDARQAVRQDVLTIKHQYDFTDREIGILHQSGLLAIYAQSAALKPSPRTRWAGYYQLAVMAALVLLAVLQIVLSSAPDWRQALGLLTVAATLGPLSYFLYRMYILPDRILQRAGISCAADVKPLPETA